MSENGHGVQVMTVENDHSYKLNEEKLEEVLMKLEIKDLPVVVISVAGAFRTGKSFLLNFFLKYFRASPEARLNGKWMETGDEPLTGFSWRGGSTRNTTGILIWSEPMIATTSTGEKVAVLLMDTQGTFDSNSSMKDCSTVFALSTLLSSVQIYNLSMKIQEDNLQHLQFFTEYGKLLKEKNGTPFQVLEFLIRDWQFPYEYEYGVKGGQDYLDDQFEIKPNLLQELKELRQHIKSSFESVTCFLMPHPGDNVTNPKFTGSGDKLSEKFKDALKEFVPSLVSEAKLKVKQVNGQPVKAKELFEYFKTYMKLFNSGEIPTPTSILKATSEAGFLLAVNEARELYESNMTAVCGGDAKSVPAHDVQQQHQREVTIALDLFNNKNKFGSSKDCAKHLKTLTKSLNEREKEYLIINMGKTQKLINEAKAAYDDEIVSIAKGQPLCVHASDLQKVHDDAVRASMNKFDSNRNVFSDSTDPDRKSLWEDLSGRISVLRITNEQNNELVKSSLKDKYWQFMMGKVLEKPRLNDDQLDDEHETAVQEALEQFEMRRSMPNQHTEDVYKQNLEKELEFCYATLKQINSSSNKGSFQAAIIAFNENMTTLLELKKHCLHPQALREDYDKAVRLALKVFRPNRSSEEEFDKSDKDEVQMLSMFKNQFEALDFFNCSANELAVSSSFDAFKSKYEYLVGPSLWWVLVVPIFQTKAQYDEASKFGVETFWNKRRDRRHSDKDTYLTDLKNKMSKWYNPLGMSENGHGVQVMTVEDDHSYKLNEEKLDEVLMKPEIKELPVVVISVAGAFRGGKSFLLNFFLKYLRASPEARLNGKWLETGDEPLTGFSWRGGSTRNTTGILIWSEPMIATTSTGERVAILLMDTQGIFDSTSSMKDCSTLFALSTLLSSVQIYNLSMKIQEDNLQHLQLFTEYGKLLKDKSGTPFQVLQFLIRDWQFPYEYEYGVKGGQDYLDNQLEITPNLLQESKELRQHIKSSFESVTCLLMPHPGDKVTDPKFTGSEISEQFRNALKELVPSLVSEAKLKVKQVNGQPVKSKEMFEYFKTYMKLFNSGEIPTPTSILKATSEAGFLLAVNEARELYESNMTAVCGGDAKSVPAHDVQQQHQREVTIALDLFNNKNKLGSSKDSAKHLKTLTKGLNEREKEYLIINMGKTQKLINEAKFAYIDVIVSIAKGQPLCVHASDLQKVHDDALRASLHKFDSNRNVFSDSTDPDRKSLCEDLSGRLSVLRLTNDQNHELVKSNLKDKYWQYMMGKVLQKPSLNENQLDGEHETAVQEALEQFEMRRSMPNQHTEDVYKQNLEKDLEFCYATLKQINSSSNKGSFQAAITAFNKNMTSLSVLKNHCLHPQALREDYFKAVRIALKVFRPTRSSDEEYDEFDEDEVQMMSMFRNQFEALDFFNWCVNELAVCSSFDAFKSKYESLTGPSLRWFLLVPIFQRKLHYDEAMKFGLETFWNKRLDRRHSDNDNNLTELKKLMAEWYIP